MILDNFGGYTFLLRISKVLNMTVIKTWFFVFNIPS